MKTELSAFFDRVRPAIEATLDGLLPAESSSPVQIHKAMRYSTLGGGKRIRSSLCVAAFAAYKENWKPILPVAAAVELIHAYSLIHDDLPAMDDDDFRRGKPSCHKQFNEAIAILEGDVERIEKYSDRIGLAFQVIDDILDTRDSKDRDQKKATYPGLHGLEQSQAIAHDLTEDARRAIAPIGKSAGLLVEFCDYLETRTH